MENPSENDMIARNNSWSEGCHTSDERFSVNNKGRKKLKKVRKEKKHKTEDPLSSPSEMKDIHVVSKKRKILKSKHLADNHSNVAGHTEVDSVSDGREPDDISQRLRSPAMEEKEQPASEPVVDKEQSDEECEMKAVKAELSQMSFEELQQLQGKLGMKVFNQVMHGKSSASGKRPSREEKKVFTRENKSMPMEVTSKKRVSRLRHVIPTKKKMVRDPRFDDKSGTYNEEIFKKSYSFIEDVREREKQKLQKQLKKAKDAEAKVKIKSLLNRMGQQQQAEEAKARKAETEKEWTRREKELVAQGKKPFFLKKSDKRKLELAEKYRELKKSGKLEKYLSKKRKKNSQKERKKMLN